MSKKQDFLFALTGKAVPEKVPAWELEFHLWDYFTDIPVVLGKSYMDLSASQREKALASNAEAFVSVCTRLGFAALTLPADYWESSPGNPAYYWLPQDAREEQLKRIQELAGNELAVVAHTGGVMSIPAADEYLEFSYKLFDDPGAIARQMNDRAASGIENAKRWTDLGVDACMSTSDLADNRGPFYNPEQMQQFVYPGMCTWASGVREIGGVSVLHSDGNIGPILEGIIESGVDALQAIDPTAGLVLADIKAKTAGRISLCGNLDCGLVQTGTPGQVFNSVVEILKIGKKNGRFVFSASNVIEKEAPPENVKAMFQAWNEYR